MWPESHYGPTDCGTLPVCDGILQLKVRAYNEPDCCGRGSGLELEAYCSRCKHPWFPGRFELEKRLQNWNGWDITDFFEEGWMTSDT